MDNEHDGRSERRQHVRHHYPLAERPMVEIEGRLCPILDICARGLRIEAPTGTAFEEGATVDVRFSRAEGDELALSGEIIHMEGSHVGILLSEAIPASYFVRECF